MCKERRLVPESRFPEFENDGEWEKKKLGDCLLRNPEYGLNAPAVPFSDSLPTYLRITDISEDGNFISTAQYWKWVSYISARSGQPGINAQEYSSIPINLPPTYDEQQKIAACLSALNEIITAQTEKIEHLHQHKKGLMQGLFPKSTRDYEFSITKTNSNS